jgi:predicted nucleotidyltransferase
VHGHAVRASSLHGKGTAAVSEQPPERPFDLRSLLAILDRHDVDYLIVGGIAVQVHGHRRTTKDLDLVPSPSPGNHERLAAALEEVEARQTGVDPQSVSVAPTDPERLRLAPIVPPLTTRHGEVHILNEVKGAAPYDELRNRALVLDLDGIEVAIVGVDDLIRMKRASGRPEDIEDIEVLTALD